MPRLSDIKGSKSFHALNPHLGQLAPTVAMPPPYEANACSQLPDTQPECNQATALDCAVSGKAESLLRTRVRFTGYRVRPLDPDNFAGGIKDLLDGLRHAGVISGDEPWRIILETEQVRVATFKEERTVITIDDGQP